MRTQSSVDAVSDINLVYRRAKNRVRIRKAAVLGMNTAKPITRLNLQGMTLEDKILGGYYKT